MTIRNRLKTVGILPILFLFLLAGYFFVISYVNYEKAHALQIILKNNTSLSSSLAQVGKERGLTALYLGSEGKEFSETLKKQRLKTDQTFTQTQQHIVYKDTAYLHPLLELLGEPDYLDDAKYTTLINNFKNIKEARKHVDTMDEPFSKIFTYRYTQKITTPLLNTISDIRNLSLNTEISTLISSLLQLSIAKENAGLERDFVAYYMLKKASMSFDEMAMWDHFKTKANGFDITQVNDTKLRTQLEKIFHTKKTTELLQALDETSSAILTDVDNGDYAEEALEWFALETKRISLITKAELTTASRLWEKSAGYLERTTFPSFYRLFNAFTESYFGIYGLPYHQRYYKKHSGT